MTWPRLEIEELGLTKMKNISVYKVLHNILERILMHPRGFTRALGTVCIYKSFSLEF